MRKGALIASLGRLLLATLAISSLVRADYQENADEEDGVRFVLDGDRVVRVGKRSTPDFVAEDANVATILVLTDRRGVVHAATTLNPGATETVEETSLGAIQKVILVWVDDVLMTYTANTPTDFFYYQSTTSYYRTTATTASLFYLTDPSGEVVGSYTLNAGQAKTITFTTAATFQTVVVVDDEQDVPYSTRTIDGPVDPHQLTTTVTVHEARQAQVKPVATIVVVLGPAGPFSTQTIGNVDNADIVTSTVTAEVQTVLVKTDLQGVVHKTTVNTPTGPYVYTLTVDQGKELPPPSTPTTVTPTSNRQPAVAPVTPTSNRQPAVTPASDTTACQPAVKFLVDTIKANGQALVAINNSTLLTHLFITPLITTLNNLTVDIVAASGPEISNIAATIRATGGAFLSILDVGKNIPAVGPYFDSFVRSVNVIMDSALQVIYCVGGKPQYSCKGISSLVRLMGHGVVTELRILQVAPVTMIIGPALDDLDRMVDMAVNVDTLAGVKVLDAAVGSVLNLIKAVQLIPIVGPVFASPLQVLLAALRQSVQCAGLDSDALGTTNFGVALNNLSSKFNTMFQNGRNLENSAGISWLTILILNPIFDVLDKLQTNILTTVGPANYYTAARAISVTARAAGQIISQVLGFISQGGTNVGPLLDSLADLSNSAETVISSVGGGGHPATNCGGVVGIAEEMSAVIFTRLQSPSIAPSTFVLGPLLKVMQDSVNIIIDSAQGGDPAVAQTAFAALQTAVNGVQALPFIGPDLAGSLSGLLASIKSVIECISLDKNANLSKAVTFVGPAGENLGTFTVAPVDSTLILNATNGTGIDNCQVYVKSFTVLAGNFYSLAPTLLRLYPDSAPLLGSIALVYKVLADYQANHGTGAMPLKMLVSNLEQVSIAGQELLDGVHTLLPKDQNYVPATIELLNAVAKQAEVLLVCIGGPAEIDCEGVAAVYGGLSDIIKSLLVPLAIGDDQDIVKMAINLTETNLGLLPSLFAAGDMNAIDSFSDGLELIEILVGLLNNGAYLKPSARALTLSAHVVEKCMIRKALIGGPRWTTTTLTNNRQTPRCISPAIAINLGIALVVRRIKAITDANILSRFFISPFLAVFQDVLQSLKTSVLSSIGDIAMHVATLARIGSQLNAAFIDILQPLQLLLIPLSGLYDRIQKIAANVYECQGLTNDGSCNILISLVRAFFKNLTAFLAPFNYFPYSVALNPAIAVINGMGDVIAGAISSGSQTILLTARATLIGIANTVTLIPIIGNQISANLQAMIRVLGVIADCVGK